MVINLFPDHRSAGLYIQGTLYGYEGTSLNCLNEFWGQAQRKSTSRVNGITNNNCACEKKNLLVQKGKGLFVFFVVVSFFCFLLYVCLFLA